MGQLTFFAVDLSRVFLRDEDAFSLRRFFAGMSFLSMNRNRSPHKVERVVRNDECPMTKE